MKKGFKALFVSVLAVLILQGCEIRSYEDGYRDGFNDASLELEVEYDLEFYKRYRDGYSDGFRRIKESRTDAEYYACDRSAFHPEEAMMVIDAYENEEPFWRNGDPPSHQDYMDATRSLYYFYEYYFNGEFSIYQDP